MIFSVIVLVLGIYVGQEYPMLPKVKDLVNIAYEKYLKKLK